MSVNMGEAVGYLDLDISGMANKFQSALTLLGQFESAEKSTEASVTGLGQKFQGAGTQIGQFSTQFTSSMTNMGTSTTNTSRIVDKFGNTLDGTESDVKGLTDDLNKADQGFEDVKNESEQAGKKVNDFGNSAQKAGKKGSVGIKEIATAIGLVKVASVVFNEIRNSLDSAIGRLDTFAKFNSVMTQFTGSAEVAEGALNKVDEAVTGTAYSLDVAAKATQNLTTAGMDINTAADQIAIWGDAVAFYSDGSSESLGQVADALAKMTSRGKVNIGQLNRIITENGIPAIKIYAEASGKSAEEVQTALSKGEISSEQFITGVSQAMKEGTASFTSIEGAAKDAEGLYSTTFANLKTAVTRGVANLIKAVEDGMKSANLGSIADNVTKLKDVINEAFSLAAKVIPPIMAILGEVFNLVSGLIGILPMLAAAFLAFQLVTKGPMALYNAYWSLYKMVSMTYTLLAAHPYALLIAAVAALAVGIYKASTAQSELRKEYEDSKAARQGAINDAKAEAMTLDTLYNRYDELMAVEGKSEQQKQELKEVINELNSEVQGLNLQYDAEKDKVNKSEAAIRKAIKARKEQIIQDALAEKQKEVLSEKIERLAQIEQDKAELDKVNAQMAKEFGDKTLDYTVTQSSRYQELLGLQNKYSDDIAENTELIKDGANEWDTYAEAAKKGTAPETVTALNNELQALTKDAKYVGGEIPKELQKGMMEGAIAVPETVKRLNELIDFNDTLKAAENAGIDIPPAIAQGLQSGEIKIKDAKARMEQILTLETLKDKWGSESNQAMSNLTAGIDSGTVSVNSAIDRIKALADFQEMVDAGLVGGKETVDRLAAGILSGDAQVQKEINAIRDKSGKNLEKNNGEAKKGKAFMDRYKKGIAEGKSPVVAAINANIDAGVATAEARKNALNSIGSAMMQGMAAGIASGGGFLTGAISSAINAGVTAGKQKAEINSPSKLFARELGLPIPEGIAFGVYSGVSMVTAALTSLVTNSVATLKKVSQYSGLAPYYASLMQGIISETAATGAKSGDLFVKSFQKSAGQGTKAAGVTAKKLGKTVKDEFEKAAKIDFKKTNKDGKKTEKQWKAALSKAKKNYKKFVQDIQKEAAKIKSTFKKDLASLNADNAKALADLKDDYSKNAESIKDNYTSTMESIYDQQKAFAERISGTDSLFDNSVVLSSKRLIQDSQKNLDALKDFDKELQTLIKKGLPNDLVEQFREMGPEARWQLMELNKLSQDELTQWLNLWQQRQELGTKMANEQYANERATAKEERDKALAEALKDYKAAVAAQKVEYNKEYKALVTQLNKDTKALTKAIKQGLINGTKLTKKERTKIADNLTKSIIKQIKKDLGIKSPSTVMEMQIGDPMGEGVTIGFINALMSGEKDMQKAIDDVTGDLEAPDIQVQDPLTNMVDGVGSLLDETLNWAESVEKKIVSIFDYMSTVFADMQANFASMKVIEGGFITSQKSQNIPLGENNPYYMQGGGDTFNFYNPKALTPEEQARQMKREKEKILLGF